MQQASALGAQGGVLGHVETGSVDRGDQVLERRTFAFGCVAALLGTRKRPVQRTQATAKGRQPASPDTTSGPANASSTASCVAPATRRRPSCWDENRISRPATLPAAARVTV